MELSNQGRATLHKNDCHESDLVSIILSLPYFVPTNDFRPSCTIIVFGSLVNAILLTRMNTSKQRRRGEILAPYVDDKNPDGGVRAWTELGDKHPDFRYIM
jgi:hypothetical protein